LRCGLLGIESPIFLGLVVLLRRRKGRAAFRRIFPGAALAVALLLGGPARTADATPVALTVDSSASGATVAIASALGSPLPVAVTLSGSVGADVTLGSQTPFGLVAQSLQLTGAAIALSDFSIGLSSVLLYDLTFSGNDVGASLTGPSTNGFPVSESFDLSSFPLVSVLPINSVAQLQVIDLGSGTNELRLTFPFSVPLNLVIDTEP
jgi:hypothetical protein